MRSFAWLASLFVAGVLSTPVYVTEHVTVVTTLVVTQGSAPTPVQEEAVISPSPEANQVIPESASTPVQEEAVISPSPEANPVIPNGGNRRHRFRYTFRYDSNEDQPIATAFGPLGGAEPTTEAPPPPPSSTRVPPRPSNPAPAPEPEPAPASEPEPEPTPASQSVGESQPVEDEAEPVSTSAPATQSGSDGSPLSGGVSLLTTANKWRSIYDLPSFTWDEQLERNALKTGVDGGGVNQVHQLGPGTNGQVITPGVSTPSDELQGYTPFELSYVAWLCEVPSDKLKTGGVDGCALVRQQLFMTYSSTGHFDILTDPKYTKIGCAFAPNPNAPSDSPWTGLWVCDVGI
jgi:hypothetical protein